MKKLFLILIIAFLSLLSIKSQAQEFPLGEFLEMYLNQDDYSLEDYVVDTSYAKKREVLDTLKYNEKWPFWYVDVRATPEFESYIYSQFYYITDIDKDGYLEYLIHTSYEGGHINFYEQSDTGLTKLLEGQQGHTFLVKNDSPEMLLINSESYLSSSRFDFTRIHNEVYKYNFETNVKEFLFNYLEPVRIPGNYGGSYTHLIYILNNPECPPFILRSNTKFYHDYILPTNNISLGTLCKGSYGWILGETVNSYFVIMDTNTKYVNDSLAGTQITVQDKGYLVCWIPKSATELGGGRASALYKDNSTNEYLRIFEGERRVYITYFTDKKFDIQMLIKAKEIPPNNMITAKFRGSDAVYKLYFTKEYQSLQCQNPDGTVQVFKRVEERKKL